MKKLFVPFLILIACSKIHAGNTILKKLKVANNSYNEYGYALTIDQQKNIYVVGLVESPSLTFQDAFVMKLDSELNQIWCYGYTTGYTWFTSIKPTIDHGFLLIGADQTAITGNGQSILVVKIDSSGSIIWSNVYAGFSGFESYNTSDGGYFIVGNGTRSLPACTKTVPAVLKIDSMGNELWNYTYSIGSCDHNEVVRDIVQTKDGGFLLTGTSYLDSTTQTGQTVSALLLIKADSAGILQWTKSYLSGTPYMVAVNGGYHIITADSGYIIDGRVTPNNSFFTHPANIKIDENGNLIWGRILNECETNTSMVHTLKSGQGFTSLVVDSNITLIETDSFSYPSRKKIFYYSLDYNMYPKLLKTGFDDYVGILISGIYAGNSDMIIFKTSMSSNDNCSVAVPDTCNAPYGSPSLVSESFSMQNFTGYSNASLSWYTIQISDSTICNAPYNGINERVNNDPELSIFPNPASGFFTIKSGTDGLYNVFIYDSGGRIIMKSITKDGNPISVRDFSPGIYFVFVKKDNQGSVLKLLVY